MKIMDKNSKNFSLIVLLLNINLFILAFFSLFLGYEEDIFNIFFVLNIVTYIYGFLTGRIDKLRPDFVIFSTSFFSYFLNYHINYGYFIKVYNQESIHLSLSYISLFLSLFLIIFNISLVSMNSIKSSGKDVKSIILNNQLSFKFLNDGFVFLIIFSSNLLYLFFVITGYKTIHTATVTASYIDIPFFFSLNMNFLSLIIAYYYLLFKDKKKLSVKLTIYFLFIVNLLNVLLSGSKAGLISLIFPFIFIYYYYYNKLNIKHFFIVLIVLEIIILLTPIISVYREYVTFSSRTSISIYERINIVKNIFSSIDFNEFIGAINNSLIILLGRLGMMDALIRTVDLTGSTLPFQEGKTIFPHLIISILPRFIYPDRMETNIGKWFGYNYGFTSSYDQAYISLGMPGEFFLNFGIYGIVFAFFTSFIISLTYIIFYKNRRNILCFLVYYLIFTTFILPYNETYFVASIVTFIKNLVTILIILMIFKLIFACFTKIVGDKSSEKSVIN